ncbi:MAG TPA: NAD(+)/NADH kinase [Chthoniobacterales bacterium]|nr:NAD(+)/NADH kinase [Chthoniobacterales bacterium]
MRPQTVGLIAHTRKPGAADLVRAVSAEFGRLDLPVFVETDTAALVGQNSGYSVRDLGREADLLVVLGGDGTLLNVVGQLGDDIKPIFGINIGSLGFLTCAASSAYREAVEHIAAGQIDLSERALLDVQIDPVGPDTRQMLRCLNDAVFSRGEISRLIRLVVRVNGEELTEFNADGLIVATPTGSTAYSLSAGGPILAPESGSLVITPICPHTLTNRSIIVDDSAVVEVEATERDYPIFLTVDGREPVRVETGSVVTVRKAAKSLPLAALPGVSFFSVVRQKLKWRGSNV